jgi:hypothetical protein
VEQKSYLRQLGTAAALSHLQVWAGVTVAVLLWWLLTSPNTFQPAAVAGMLGFSAAFQLMVFGVAAWTARYRSRALGGLALAVLFPAALAVQTLSPPGHVSHAVLWMAGITAVLGLLITWNAYRRWLVADFD